MLVRFLGMITLANPEQPSKTLLPKIVTLLGIVIAFKPVQKIKAPSPTLVTLPEMETLVSAVQLLNE